MLMPLNVLGAPAAIRPECGLSPAVPLAVRSDPQRSRRPVALVDGGACPGSRRWSLWHVTL